MPKKKKPALKAQTVVIAPDRPTASLLCRTLADEGLSAVAQETCRSAREAVASARNRPCAAVLAACARQAKAQLELASDLGQAGVAVFAWASGRLGSRSEYEDEWILDRLLEQGRALVSARLQVLAQAVKIHCLAGRPRADLIRIAGRASGLKERLDAALGNLRFPVTRSGRARSAWTIRTGAGGELWLEAGQGGRLALSDPDTAASALGLLARPRGFDQQIDDPGVEVSSDEVELITRPPSRVLSEHTSKRLAACFGLVCGEERLCGSATEAVRFASKLAGPVVLKAARPGLENKRAAGAIRTGIRGPSAVRRVFYALESAGESVSSAKSLGVLVAGQVHGGLRTWVRMSDHRRFGRLLLGGAGDALSDRPAWALKTPCDANEALRALTDAGVAQHTGEAVKTAVAIGRFSKMVHALGPCVSRAEIHPLVATADRDSAMALDMLVAISTPRGK